MIYKRQKILLLLLKLRRKPLRKIPLIKLLFLLKLESNLKHLDGFYDFLPYKYGPFSFTVYRDLRNLAIKGFIYDNDNEIKTSMRYFKKEHYDLPSSIYDEVSEILERYGEYSNDDLIDYVYGKYKWYASRSELKKVSFKIHPVSTDSIITIGYEGISIDFFFNKIMRKGIKSVIDVRANPISHKYGFSKSTFSNLCKKLKINYYHFPELGIPSSYRTNIESFKQVDYVNLWKFYSENIIANNSDKLLEIESICSNSPSVIVCFESNHLSCHRSSLANILSKNAGLKIIHL